MAPKTYSEFFFHFPPLPQGHAPLPPLPMTAPLPHSRTPPLKSNSSKSNLVTPTHRRQIHSNHSSDPLCSFLCLDPAESISIPSVHADRDPDADDTASWHSTHDSLFYSTPDEEESKSRDDYHQYYFASQQLASPLDRRDNAFALASSSSASPLDVDLGDMFDFEFDFGDEDDGASFSTGTSTSESTSATTGSSRTAYSGSGSIYSTSESQVRSRSASQSASSFFPGSISSSTRAPHRNLKPIITQIHTLPPQPPSNNPKSSSRPDSVSRDRALPRPKPAPRATLPLPAPPAPPTSPIPHSAPPLRVNNASFSRIPGTNINAKANAKVAAYPIATATPAQLQKQQHARPVTAPSERRVKRKPVPAIVFGVYEPREERLGDLRRVQAVPKPSPFVTAQRAVPAPSHILPTPSHKPVAPIPKTAVPAHKVTVLPTPTRPPRPLRPLSVTTTTSFASTHHRLANRGDALARLEGRAPVSPTPASAGAAVVGGRGGLLPFGPVSLPPPKMKVVSQQPLARPRPLPTSPVSGVVGSPVRAIGRGVPAPVASRPLLMQAAPRSAGVYGYGGGPWKETPKSFMPFSTFEDSEDDDVSEDGGDEDSEGEEEGDVDVVEKTHYNGGEAESVGESRDLRAEVELVSVPTNPVLKSKMEKMRLEPPALHHSLSAGVVRSSSRRKKTSRSRSHAHAHAHARGNWSKKGTPSKSTPLARRSRSSVSSSKRGTIASWYVGPEFLSAPVSAGASAFTSLEDVASLPMPWRRRPLPPVPGNFMDFGDDGIGGASASVIQEKGRDEDSDRGRHRDVEILVGTPSDDHDNNHDDDGAFHVEERMIFRDGEESEVDTDAEDVAVRVWGLPSRTRSA